MSVKTKIKEIGGVIGVIIFLSLILLLVYKNMAPSKNDTNPEEIQKNYRIVAIEDCEYIIYDERTAFGSRGYMSHKGNCESCRKK